MAIKETLNRRFSPPMGTPEVQSRLKQIFGNILTDPVQEQISKKILKIVPDFSAPNKEAVKTTLRSTIVEETGLKMSEGVLDKIIGQFKNNDFHTWVVTLESVIDHLDRLVNDVPERCKAVLSHAIPRDKTYAIMGVESGQPDYLMGVIVDAGKFLWIPALILECTLGSGVVMNEHQVDNAFIIIIKSALGQIAHRGLAEVEGPKGGKYICGDLFSDKQIKPEDVLLENGYKVRLLT